MNINIYSIIAFVCFLIYFFLGIHIFSINRKQLQNKLFILICITLTISTFLSIFVYSAKNLEEVKILFKLAIIPLYLFFLLIFLFSITLAKVFKFNKLFIIVFCIPPLLFVIKEIYGSVIYSNFEFRNNIWIFTPDLKNPWYYFYIIYCISCICFCSFILFYWRRKDKSYKVKKLSNIISLSLFSFLFTTFINDVVFNKFITKYPIPPLGPSLIIIWIIGIWYSIIKFKFLTINTELISNDVISNINESIILLDSDLKIFFINKKTEELIREEKNKIINKDFKEFILKYDLVKNEIDKMLKNQYKDFSCRIYFKSKNEPILMDAKFSKVFDKFDDLLGILIIGNEVKELKQLKLFYKLSDRETEIIQSLVDGQSNKKIGDELNLVESTVKSHITHIFNKLGVNNRVELMNLLYEFNVIPSHSSEKKVLILK